MVTNLATLWFDCSGLTLGHEIGGLEDQVLKWTRPWVSIYKGPSFGNFTFKWPSVELDERNESRDGCELLK